MKYTISCQIPTVYACEVEVEADTPEQAIELGRKLADEVGEWELIDHKPTAPISYAEVCLTEDDDRLGWWDERHGYVAEKENTQ